MTDKNTTFIARPDKKDVAIEKVLHDVYLALNEKGYKPIDQLVGYVMSGDPTYITSHNNARSLIASVDRDDIMEVLIKNYLTKFQNKEK